MCRASHVGWSLSAGEYAEVPAWWTSVLIWVPEYPSAKRPFHQVHRQSFRFRKRSWSMVIKRAHFIESGKRSARWLMYNHSWPFLRLDRDALPSIQARLLAKHNVHRRRFLPMELFSWRSANLDVAMNEFDWTWERIFDEIFVGTTLCNGRC